MKEVIEIAVANYSQMIITLMIIKLINLKEDIIIKKLYLIMKILTMIIKMIKVDQTIQLEIVKAFCKFNNKECSLPLCPECLKTHTKKHV